MVNALNDANIKTYIVTTERPFDFTIYSKVKRIMEQECLDLLHIHGTRAGSNTLIQALMMNLTSMYTVHGWSFHSGISKLALNIRQLSEKFLLKKADLIVCGSQSDLSTGKALSPIQVLS